MPGDEPTEGVLSDAAMQTGASGLGFGRRIAIEAERTVDAPIETVWRLLRDYRGPHARLLGEPFAGYELHDGGVGTGTVIGYRLRVGRHERSYVLGVEEPTPGRQLRERDHHGRLLRLDPSVRRFTRLQPAFDATRYCVVVRRSWPAYAATSLAVYATAITTGEQHGRITQGRRLADLV